VKGRGERGRVRFYFFFPCETSALNPLVPLLGHTHTEREREREREREKLPYHSDHALYSHAVCLFRFCCLILKAFFREIKLHLAALLMLKGFIKMSGIVRVTGANGDFAWKFAF